MNKRQILYWRILVVLLLMQLALNGCKSLATDFASGAATIVLNAGDTVVKIFHKPTTQPR